MLNNKQLEVLGLIDNEETRSSLITKANITSNYVSMIAKILLIGGYIFKRSPYGLTDKGKDILNEYKTTKGSSGI